MTTPPFVILVNPPDLRPYNSTLCPGIQNTVESGLTSSLSFHLKCVIYLPEARQFVIIHTNPPKVLLEIQRDTNSPNRETLPLDQVAKRSVFWYN